MTPAIFALLLALTKGGRHGYALMEDVAALTDGVVTLGPGTLYRSLQRMRVDGLIDEAVDPDEEITDRRGERRRRYRITDVGRRALAAEAERLSILVTAAIECGVIEQPGPANRPRPAKGSR